MQANSKTREGDSHPDRDAQFAHINARVSRALADHQAVISVDTKKKELVGDFKNAGREWRPQGDPQEVRAHDFLIKELGRAVPYGVHVIGLSWMDYFKRGQRIKRDPLQGGRQVARRKVDDHNTRG